MALNKVLDAMLANGTLYASKAAAEAENPLAPGSDLINVIENNYIVKYLRVSGATDLVGADSSTWQKANFTNTDGIALAGDLSALFTGINTIRGVWTPDISWSGSGGSTTYNAREGRWSLTDNKLFVEVSMNVTLDTLGADNLRIGGIQSGYRPMAGAFPGYLDIKAKSSGFFLPYQGADLRISWTGGSSTGVFAYSSAAGYTSRYVNTISGDIAPDYSSFTYAGGSARVVAFYPDPSTSGEGRIVYVNESGTALGSGVNLTGSGWTATTAGAWNGAPSGENFLNAGNFSTGQTIGFTAVGEWRVS